jgi:hypothetical protein
MGSIYGEKNSGKKSRATVPLISARYTHTLSHRRSLFRQLHIFRQFRCVQA